MKKIVLLFVLISMYLGAGDLFTDNQGYENCECATNQASYDVPFKWIVYKDIDEVKNLITGGGTYNFQIFSCMDNRIRSKTKSKIISDIIIVSPVYPVTYSFTVDHQDHGEVCSCGIDNVPYPVKDNLYRYFNINTSEKSQYCLNTNGIIEKRFWSCREQQRCKYCIQPSDPTPPPPEDTNTTHWELIDEVSCADEDDSLSDKCTDTNATGILIQSWNTGCCGENKKCYVSTPVCDENQTLDMNTTPPICRDDNCTEPDETYDYPVELESVAYKESCADSTDADQVCEDNNGTWYKMSRINCCVQSICLIDPNRCDEEDTSFPPKANNQSVTLSWDEDNDRSAECATYPNHEQQHKRVACKSLYRCLSSICPKEEDEPVGSYVSPHNRTFHEDIAIAGSDYKLHYSSAKTEETTIAHGWSISPHAILRANKLYYGSGSFYIVKPLNEGNLTVVKSGSKEMVFNALGQLLYTRHLYTKKQISTFSYDNMGRLVTITDIYGQITNIERDNSGIVTTIVSPTGQRTLVNINNNGDLTEVQYEDTSSYAFEYEHHLMTVEHEPNGNSFLHFFDKFGHIVKVIDAEQGEWFFGSTTSSGYGSHTVHRASGDIIVYKNHFVNNGILKTEKLLPSGDLVHYETAIDESMYSSTSCGTKTTNLYKKNSDGTLYKDAFTQRKLLASSTVTTPYGLSKVTTYNTGYENNAQRITKTITTNSKTHTTIRDYIAHTQIISTAEGKTSTITYDTDNAQVIKTEPFFKMKPYTDYATYYTYDDKGRVTQEKFKNRITKYSYDSQGNLHTITNPLGETTTYSYDALGRVSSIKYADEHILHYTYDKNGNMTTLVTPSVTQHEFAYNSVNSRTHYTSPLQKVTSYHYDKQRRLTHIIKPSGKSIEYHYNNGRIDYIQRTEGKSTYSYDCQSNPSSITKGDESVAYHYDGTLLTSIMQSGMLNETINYSYNNDFLASSLNYAGTTTNYHYNLDNEMTQAEDMQIEKIYRSWATYTQYKTEDFKVTYADAFYGDGIRWHYDNKFQYFNYTQENKAGQIIWRFDYTRKTGGHSFRYKYDKRGRLIEVKDLGKIVERYTYDANGNRATETVKQPL